MSIQEDDGRASPRVSPQRDVLLALAERCEQEEPSQELDEAIAVLCDPEVTPDNIGMICQFGGLSRYTTGLDAALTLVPEGTEYELNNLYGVAYVEVGLNFGEVTPGNAHRNDGNLPMTLCAAALRARAALAGEDGNGAKRANV